MASICTSSCRRAARRPAGLIGKPLQATDGYDGETVWYDALSADPFVAKCVAPVAEARRRRCLRTVYLGPGIAAVYAFDARVLATGREFDPRDAGQCSTGSAFSRATSYSMSSRSISRIAIWKM